jgi:hypothetical protein
LPWCNSTKVVGFSLLKTKKPPFFKVGKTLREVVKAGEIKKS